MKFYIMCIYGKQGYIFFFSFKGLKNYEKWASLPRSPPCTYSHMLRFTVTDIEFFFFLKRKKPHIIVCLMFRDITKD